MVGVPRLAKCASGPSSRIGCPAPWRVLRLRISQGPITKATISAVISAPPVRNVRYRNRLKTMYSSASGNRKL